MLLAAVLTGGALPGLGADEARVTIDITAPPWSSVARLQVPGTSRCTAVRVGPQTVVTAAHCLYGRRTGRFVPPSSVHILLGYTLGQFDHHVLARSFAVAPGYDPGAPGASGADLAVVTLAAAVPGPSLELHVGPVPPGTPLMLGGFGQDRAERVLADPACRALGTALGQDGRPLLVHDCAGTRGTSGGPVLAQASDGSWRLAGIQVAGNAGVGGSAIPAAAIRALLPIP